MAHLQQVLELTTDSIHRTDSLGRSALFWAVLRNNVDYVRLLLSYGADPNMLDLRGSAPVDVVRGPAVCRLLLEAGAKNNINPQKRCSSSVHEQARIGCADEMSLFKEAGFDIEPRDYDNETPLLNATYFGHTAMVERLIEFGADISNANNSSRDSALHFAANFDRSQILKILLERGADYTVLNCNGRSIAHCAARAGSTELVRVIAKANLERLDLTLRDHDGQLPSDYMSERIVITDPEVGVHEAWDDLVINLKSLSRTCTPVTQESEMCVKELSDLGPESNSQELKVPGAFPITKDIEV